MCNGVDIGSLFLYTVLVDHSYISGKHGFPYYMYTPLLIGFMKSHLIEVCNICDRPVIFKLILKV